MYFLHKRSENKFSGLSLTHFTKIIDKVSVPHFPYNNFGLSHFYSSSSSEDEGNDSNSSVGDPAEEMINRNIIAQVSTPVYTLMETVLVRMGYTVNPRHLPPRRPEDRPYDVMANPIANMTRVPATLNDNLSNARANNDAVNNNTNEVINTNNNGVNNNTNNEVVNNNTDAVNNNASNDTVNNNISNGTVNNNPNNVSTTTNTSTGNTNSSNTSLIDDYADPNLEQPSYMDPED